MSKKSNRIKCSFQMRKEFRSEHYLLDETSRVIMGIRAVPPRWVEMRGSGGMGISGREADVLDWMREAMDIIRKEASRVW
jgi:hypothetical protein